MATESQTLIADLMTPEPLTFDATTPLATCAERMQRLGARHAVVLDGGRPVGLLTDARVYGAGLHDGAGWSFPDRVAGPLAEPAPTLRDDQPASIGLRALVGREAGIVVGADGELVGVISAFDAVRIAPVALPAYRTVREVATRPMRALPSEAPLLDAWRAMLDAGVRHLGVTDGGKLTGVVSLRDLVRVGVRAGDTRRLGELARGELHTVPAETPVRDAARRMGSLGVGCLPTVYDSGEPSGILTRSDVLALLADALDDEALFGATRGLAGRTSIRAVFETLRRGGAPIEPLRDQLAAHYAREEAPGDGLFARLLRDGSPASEIDVLREAHAALLSRLDALTGRDPWDAEAARARHDLADAIQQQEYLEAAAAFRLLRE